MTLAPLFLMVVLAQAPEPGALLLRAGEPSPAHAPVAVGESGVSVGLTGDPPVVVRVVSWDRVREVRGPLADAADQYADLAEAAWRARVRLERNDPRAAEPEFERALSMLTRTDGATARVLHEGLLRCRLRRGATTAAIEPWILLLASEAPGEAAAAFRNAAPVLDASTDLCPSLPPIFAPVPSTRLALSLADRSGSLPAQEADLAALYAHAAAVVLGEPRAWPEPVTSGPAVALVRDCVAAQDADADRRDSARKRLTDRLTGVRRESAAPPWAEAWCHTALGRSLVLESEPEIRLRGVVHLLHVPAVFRYTHPALAGLCLADAATVMEELGDLEAARILASELARGFPGHPALDTLRPALWRLPGTPSTPPPNGPDA